MKKLIVSTVIIFILITGFFVVLDGDNRAFVDEVNKEVSPFNSDADRDGLKGGQEANWYDYNATKIDTNIGGIADIERIDRFGTSPINIYSDGYDVDDNFKINGETDVISKPECNVKNKDIDTDGDGLSDYKECQLGADPTRVDTDSDGLTDYEEVRGVTENGIDISESDPTHMDLYVTIVETDNIDFNSYTSPRSKENRSIETEKNKAKDFFSSSRVKNPDGSNGIDIHFSTIERPDEEIVLSNTTTSERQDIRDEYHIEYNDSYIHSLYITAELGNNSSISGEAIKQQAIGVPWWNTLSHEILHTVVHSIDTSECIEGGAYHICSGDGILNKGEDSSDDIISNKTINEIDNSGFHTSRGQDSARIRDMRE